VAEANRQTSPFAILALLSDDILEDFGWKLLGGFNSTMG
jgi:hypothetical protein